MHTCVSAAVLSCILAYQLHTSASAAYLRISWCADKLFAHQLLCSAAYLRISCCANQLFAYLLISRIFAYHLFCWSAAYLRISCCAHQLIISSASLLIIDCPAVDQLGHFSWKSQRCVWCLAPAPLNLSTKLSSWSSAEKFSSWSAEQLLISADQLSFAAVLSFECWGAAASAHCERSLCQLLALEKAAGQYCI